MTISDAQVTTPSTPSEQASKRSKRQTKLTEIFSVGRRSSTRNNAKSLVESPILQRKKAGVKGDSVKEGGAKEGGVKEVIVAIEEPLVKTEKSFTVHKEDDAIYVDEPERPSPFTVHADKTEQPSPLSPLPLLSPLSPPSPLLSPLSPPLSPFTVADLPAVPAYQRFAHLISTSRPLPLPSKFTLLEKILGAIDSLCMLSAGRDQPVIFHRVLRSLESSVGHRIELKHLKQIHGIFVNEKLGQVSPPFKYQSTTVVWEGKRTKSAILDLPEMPTHDYLAGRRAELVRRMTELLKEKHQSFLESINVTIPDGSRIRSWHPKFILDTVDEVPEVEFLEQSPPPIRPQSTPREVANVLKKVDSRASLKEKTSDTTPKRTPPPLGVLDRIRAKQREAELATMVEDPVREEKRKKLECLLSFSETVAMLFATVNKSTLLLGDAVNKISQGSKSSISSDEILQRLEDLSTIVPEWIVMVNSGTVKTLRLNRSTTLQAAKDRISETLKIV